jgi:small subunit ribosomal protein S18
LERFILVKRVSKPRSKKRKAFIPKRKICHFCSEKIENISYKDTTLLQWYLSDMWKIEKRRKTGTCAKHQRALARAIKRARHLALLPHVAAHVNQNDHDISQG